MDRQTRRVHEDARVEETRRRNQQFAFELLTPKAAASLFGITPTAVRQAVRNGHVHVSYRVSSSLAGRTTNLLDMHSALDYWRGRCPDDIEDQIESMRRECMTFAIDNGLCYNVLHPTRLITFAGDQA